MDTTKQELGYISTVLLFAIGALFVAGGWYSGVKHEKQLQIGSTITTTTLQNTINEFRLNVNSSTDSLNSHLNALSSTVDTYGTIVTQNTPLGATVGGTAQSSAPSDLQLWTDVSGSAGYKTLTASSGIDVTTSTSAIYISSQGVDTSDNFTWTGTHSFADVSSLTASTATSTATSTDVFNLLPAGIIQMYAASSTAPAGWIFADGTEYTTTTYPRLFSVIGYVYGGSTSTFKVPDFKGRNPIGFGSATTTIDTLGETGGELTHLQTTDEMPSHTHSDGIDSGTGCCSGGGNFANSIGTTGATGGGTAFNVLDPYIVIKFIIKY